MNPNVVTVKFKDAVTINTEQVEVDETYKTDIYSILRTEAVRENKLGFIDLRCLPKEHSRFCDEL